MVDLKKLLKWRENFVALSLALVISFTCTGCQSKEVEEELEEPFSYSQDEEKLNKVVVEDSEPVKEEEELNIASYLEAIMSVPIMYNYEEYYLTYEQVEKLILEAEKKVECHNEYSGNLEEEIEELISQIEDNSLKFLEGYPEYERILWFKDLYLGELDTDVDFLNIVFNITLKFALKHCLEDATNDIAEDICKLKELSIVAKRGNFQDDESIVFGSYLPELNAIVLNVDTIYQELLNEKNEEELGVLELDEAIEKTLLHELNHVRQQACSCRLEEDAPSTLEYQDAYSFIMEASAESALYNQEQDYMAFYKEKYDYTYYFERERETLILLLGLFHDDIKIDDYYNAIFDSDLEAFYRFCGVKTEEEKYVLHKIWFALDSLESFNSFPYEVTGEKVLTRGKIQDIVGTSYCVDIFKLVLSHMVDYTFSNSELTVEDNLALFNIIKSIIVEEARKLEETGNEEDPYYFVYDAETKSSIKELENLYIDFLSDYYEMSEEELRDLEQKCDISLYRCNANSDDLSFVYRYNFDEYLFLDKYPILKYILSMSYISKDDYQKFLEADVILSRKK
ncbi:unknown [Mycoplasma sp. CAG:776]|nr:unknown [Mycoplasma sp. CAG:776]